MDAFNPLMAMRAAMRNSAGLDRAERDTLLVIIDRQPNCRISTERMAADAKYDKGVVLDAIARLEAKGVISVDRPGPRKMCTYHLTADWEKRVASVPPAASGGATPPEASRSSGVTPPEKPETGGATPPTPPTPWWPDTTSLVALHHQSGGATPPQDSKESKKKAKVVRLATEPKKPPADVDPRVRPVIDHYHSTYREVTGEGPSGNDYGRAGKTIAKLPPAVSASAIMHAVTVQLTQRRGLEFTRGADWNSLPDILAHLDEIRAWLPRKATLPTNGDSSKTRDEWRVHS